MMTNCTSVLLLLATLMFTSGCINRATATLSPGADLSRVKSFYVVHQPSPGIGLFMAILKRAVDRRQRAVINNQQHFRFRLPI
jgi:hypothetical protein